MKEDKSDTKQKGSEQPPTKVGLDDERQKTGELPADDPKEKRQDKGGITDAVMEHQSKDHQVQRT